MTLNELNDLLVTTGYPVAYDHFSSEQTAPYICYMTPYSNNFSADGIAYQKINHVQIELYTAKKDIAAESAVESALDGADIFYDKTETFVDSEKMYEIIFDCEVI